MDHISARAVAKSFQKLYNNSRDRAGTDYNIVTSEGNLIPVHSFVLKTRYIYID